MMNEMAEEIKIRRHAEIRAGVQIQKERAIQEMRNGQSVVHPPIVWTGKLRDLGVVTRELFEKGFLKATSEMNALEQVCRHFVRRNGAPIDPRSLWQNLKNKRDKDEGDL
jgi:hypothetical protein